MKIAFEIEERVDPQEQYNDDDFVIATADQEAELDSALGLKMVSFRLQESLINELKVIAKTKGLGYQPLARMVLTEFVENHKRKHDISKATKEIVER
ncbi:BrnA antitoxin family protein [Chromobacterium haemolyticum]|uniref:CopG family antitoxin n=1 Tax=Chromobacterium haemolyticum TaxID=394935 RepID=UPI00193C47F8|nr:BrnA antitoxin family protein [Chromobacterium haemolyticum]